MLAAIAMQKGVFPASAGMNRLGKSLLTKGESIPRIRGDEPLEAAAKALQVEYSPHPRG